MKKVCLNQYLAGAEKANVHGKDSSVQVHLVVTLYIFYMLWRMSWSHG